MESNSVNCMWLLLLFLANFGSSEDINAWGSLNADILLPYGPGKPHGPSHSHRYVRDCQLVSHGNITYETWRGDSHTQEPMAVTKLFVSSVRKGWVYGHLTYVSDPLRTFSVLEPGGEGGCSEARTETVSQTATPRRCLYAQNGGFFNTSSRACLGNVVSDGTLVQNSKGVQNAQFGIRRDGTLVIGYLSEEDVLDKTNPFVQLVSGVVWLLRNGEVYIEESMVAECSNTQETGSFQRFVNVVSARTALGHDAEGRLVLFHIDGETDARGLNLWDVADVMKKHGIINAINLDGGGSSTFVVNGSLASYPSDSCSDKNWRCPRPVSTVLCVHEPHCQPSECGHHGLCTQYGCACEAGWIGSNCSQACEAGFYGDGCNRTCACANGGTCDPVHGRCSCLAGYQGNHCEQECPLGFHGLKCKDECQCPDTCPCDPVTGSCNFTLWGVRNHTLQRAGHCLAVELFGAWVKQSVAHEVTPYLAERTWMIISVILGTLFLASAMGNVIQAYRKPGVAKPRAGYSYVPLSQMAIETDYEDRQAEIQGGLLVKHSNFL